MGTTLDPNDATHAMHSCAAVIPFLAAIASSAETRARLCLKFYKADQYIRSHTANTTAHVSLESTELT